VQQVARRHHAITEQRRKVKGLVDEVSLASRQQTQGIDQVAQAIAQMEKVTQTTAATAEESAAASEELSAQAETAMDVVRQLETLVARRARRRSTSSKTPAPCAGRAGASGAKTHSAEPTPEELLPLESTGTYGRF
jgi:hypothetical protein